MSESRTSKRFLRATEHEREAVALRKAGYTFDQIAVALGITRSGAWRSLRRAMGRIESATAETISEMRGLEGERLDGLWAAAWPAAQQGDLAAIKTCVMISERRCRLWNLDAEVNAMVTGLGKDVTILWPHEIDKHDPTAREATKPPDPPPPTPPAPDPPPSTPAPKQVDPPKSAVEVVPASFDESRLWPRNDRRRIPF